jgi:hypothetical protein
MSAVRVCVLSARCWKESCAKLGAAATGGASARASVGVFALCASVQGTMRYVCVGGG